MSSPTLYFTSGTWRAGGGDAFVNIVSTKTGAEMALAALNDAETVNLRVDYSAEAPDGATEGAWLNGVAQAGLPTWAQ